MVILQFNRLIRNKWVWGVFAVAVSLFFCMDESILRGDSSEGTAGSAGLLGEEKIDNDYFYSVAEDIRGFGRNRDDSLSFTNVNAQAWEFIAALDTAARNGIAVSDDEVASIIRADRSFAVNGAFSFRAYRARLMEVGLTPERFEEYLKRRITLVRMVEAVSDSASWAAPAELEQAIDDMTDSITVKIARFSQKKAEADAVKVDEAGLKKWYEENSESLALPDRIKIRYIRFDATDPAVLAKMAVTDDEMHDYYDVMSDKFTVTDTNGVEKVKPFDEVKGEVEKELRQIAAVQYFETNLLSKVYGSKAVGKSKLDDIAKEESRKVVTSDYFSLQGGYREGFMKHISSILPGGKNTAEVVAELDPEVEDLRYGIVMSDKVVWLVERAEFSAAHTPSFEAARKVVEKKALADARQKAFKASVEAVAAKGVDAVVSGGSVSTNIVFAVCDLQPGTFPDQSAVIREAVKLDKGAVSGFVSTSPSSGLLVVCVDRKRGDAAKAAIMRSQIAADVQMLQRRQVPESWRKYNLERIGFAPQASAAVVADEE